MELKSNLYVANATKSVLIAMATLWKFQHILRYTSDITIVTTFSSVTGNMIKRWICIQITRSYYDVTLTVVSDEESW